MDVAPARLEKPWLWLWLWNSDERKGVVGMGCDRLWQLRWLLLTRAFERSDQVM